MLLSVRDDLMGLAIKLLSEVGHSEELVFMPYLFALANSASNEKTCREYQAGRCWIHRHLKTAVSRAVFLSEAVNKKSRPAEARI